MKLAIDVKNNGKTTFDKNDFLLFDGKQWYITTYEDVYYDLNCKINNAIEKLNFESEKIAEKTEKLEKEFNEYKRNVSEQLLEMSQLIKKLYGGDSGNE